MRRLDDSVAIGALSLGVLEIFKQYRDTAPSLADLRAGEPYNYRHRQLLLDADMLGIIIVIAVGGGAAFLTRKLYPLLLAGVSLGLISGYYRAVLRSPNLGFEEEKEEESKTWR
jgi:hypothetical protein